MQKVSEHIIYFLLFIVLVLSLSISFSYFFVDRDVWVDVFSKVYLIILLVTTWYFFILLFIEEFRQRQYHQYSGERISVIMPCYNEEPQLLRRAVTSLVRARGDKEIIIIDDGSTHVTRDELRRLERKYRSCVRLYRYYGNRGKREGLHYAIKYLVRGEFIVTVDSDTVLHPDALVRIVEPLMSSRIAASTGNVLLLNEKKNWLTRMVGTYYWIGLNYYKKAQSGLGIVVCCSGCLSAYRTSVIRSVIDEFVSQRFMGERCTHSEDRHLTNLILREGFRVVYRPEAICATHTPDTVKGFLKQQQRWKRGYIRESIYTLTHAWKGNKVLFFEVLIWDLTAPIYVVGLRLITFTTLFLEPRLFLTFILPAWIVFMIVRYMVLFLRAYKKIPGLFVYMFFYEFFMYWQYIYALFTVKNKRWITR